MINWLIFWTVLILGIVLISNVYDIIMQRKLLKYVKDLKIRVDALETSKKVGLS